MTDFFDQFSESDLLFGECGNFQDKFWKFDWLFSTDKKQVTGYLRVYFVFYQCFFCALTTWLMS